MTTHGHSGLEVGSARALDGTVILEEVDESLAQHAQHSRRDVRGDDVRAAGRCRQRERAGAAREVEEAHALERCRRNFVEQRDDEGVGEGLDARGVLVGDVGPRVHAWRPHTQLLL